MSTLRCFVALELDDAMRRSLQAAGTIIRTAEPTWHDEKWASPDRLHVTLKFLGDVDERQLSAIEAALAEVARRATPFELQVKGLRPVPGTQSCRMLWASFRDPSGGCSALASAVEESLVELGFEGEKRSFKPHATLCRARRPKHLSATSLSDAESMPGLSEDSMSVGSVSLISSKLGRGEPEYTTLVCWPLGG